MKLTSIALIAAGISSSGALANPATLSIIDTPALVGVVQYKGFSAWAEQNAYQAYDTTGNIALGKAVTVSGTISGYSAIHSPSYLTDGFYGNGSSWIDPLPNSFIVVDLASIQNVNSVIFGRDRVSSLDDRDPGAFSISLSSDGSNFAPVFTSSVFIDGPNYKIIGNDSVKVSFDASASRYVKLSFANAGTAIDEVQITAAVPEPETYAMYLAGLGLMGGIARRRKRE